MKRTRPEGIARSNGRKKKFLVLSLSFLASIGWRKQLFSLSLAASRYHFRASFRSEQMVVYAVYTVCAPLICQAKKILHWRKVLQSKWQIIRVKKTKNRIELIFLVKVCMCRGFLGKVRQDSLRDKCLSAGSSKTSSKKNHKLGPLTGSLKVCLSLA